MKTLSYLVSLIFTLVMISNPLLSFAATDAYNLQKVNGISAFNGSAAAREILGKNGFVVADPTFKQIFEAYIESPRVEKPSEKNPMGRSLPSFITTDSAWHTYHVLLEEGVKDMEEGQSRKLLAFSMRLWTAVRDQAPGQQAGDLALFVSIGLALQDEQHRNSLPAPQKTIVNALRIGSTDVTVPIGFSLSPLQFRAQSFYTQSSELSDYFAARQWYATVVFRLSSARETKAAIALATLIAGDPEQLALWKQLSEPFDLFLAATEDGTVKEYAEVAKAAGANLQDVSALDTHFAEIEKRLDTRLPFPRVSDQLLQPNEYAAFSKLTRGFRLLPPRRLPCAVCFHNTVDPKIPNRRYPSGLDFFAASPELRSPAAVRALESQFGKPVAEAILKADCGTMPDSLHGEAMRLLTTLQKPLPSQAPAAMRSETWSDLQLWSQLAAWAEQRHTWALHTKLTVSYAGIITPPVGMAAPYPGFFSGLARLTRRTADAFEGAGLDPKFNLRTAAVSLLEALEISETGSRRLDEKEFERNSGRQEQLNQFQNRCYEKHRTEFENDKSGKAWEKFGKDLKDLARRVAALGEASEADTETLRSFYDCRENVVRLLRDFAPVCDRLTELAKKSLAGEPLTGGDAKWVEHYGVTLARFHFYYGNSYEVPLDNFPIVTRVFSNPLFDSMLYAGLARPQALYVIVPDGKSLQLYRGSVLTYREFVRPNDKLLDDQSWRELISKGQVPPPPPFTRSFCTESTVSELIGQLHVQRRGEDDEDYHDSRDILWQIGSRAGEKDLPKLLDTMIRARGDGRGEIVDGMAEIIAPLPWESHLEKLIQLLASNDQALADAAARILIERPASLDPAVFISRFTKQSSRARRLYCAILSRLPRQTEATSKLFLQALRDQVDGVRWQATLAIEKAGWNDALSQSALFESLNDPNEFVGAAAAHSLAKLGATAGAPLLAKLRSRLAAGEPAAEELGRQSTAIRQEMGSDLNRAPEFQLLDPYNLEMRLGRSVPEQAKQMAAMRFPPRPFDFPTHDFTLVDASIEALGELVYSPAADELFKLRGTRYDAEATRALNKIAPERLQQELLAKAGDNAVDSYLREQALVTLARISATNHVRDIIPLLDDTTPITYSRPLPGPEWRICDRAAATIAMLLR